MKFTEIKIAGLKDGNHQFRFELNSSFLTAFSDALFQKPEVRVVVDLALSETMIKSLVTITGKVELTCDRSLEKFFQPVSVQAPYFFKFGEEEKELSDELEVILKERVSIDFDQLVYDFIALSLPSRRLHPRFQTEESSTETDGEIVFSTKEEEVQPSENEAVDPRWAKLKELKV